MLKAEFLRARIFQFTPLREGRPLLMRVCAGQHSTRFQFTPLREGRREVVPGIKIVPRISIHAPPRGATRMVSCALPPMQFQFTPLREGRQRRTTFGLQIAGFQFTPLREGRPAGMEGVLRVD